MIPEMPPCPGNKATRVAHVSGLAWHGALLAHAQVSVVVTADRALETAELALQKVGVFFRTETKRRLG